MSNPIKELEKACKLIGEKCNDLVKERKDKHIGDIRFVNEFFLILNEMKNGKEKQEVLKDLESYAKDKLKREELEWLK